MTLVCSRCGGIMFTDYPANYVNWAIGNRATAFGIENAPYVDSGEVCKSCAQWLRDQASVWEDSQKPKPPPEPKKICKKCKREL